MQLGFLCYDATQKPEIIGDTWPHRTFLVSFRFSVWGNFASFTANKRFNIQLSFSFLRPNIDLHSVFSEVQKGTMMENET